LVELAGDAYVAQHGLLTAVEHPGIGCALGIGLLTYGADNQPATVLAARRPGMDTLDLLQEYGFEPRIGEFLRDKVVAIGEAVVLNTPQAKDYWGKIDLGQPSLLGGLEPTPEALKIPNTSQPFPTVAVSKYR
jgi:hypothetical protein